jgi:hypothetical protein
MPESKRRKPKYTGPTPPKERRPALVGDQDKPSPIQLVNQQVGAEYDPGTVCAAYIHPGEVRGEFAASLFVSAKEIPELMGLAVRQSGPRVAAARNRIVREFLLTKFEWLLFIDSDMDWTPQHVRYLLETADAAERPVVGGLCFADQMGQLFPTIYQLDEEGSYHVALDYPMDKAFPVDGTGAAFILIHRRVLERLEQKHSEPTPWFADSIVNGEERGEDLTFCQRVRDLGYPIYLDARAKIGHTKQRRLTEEEWINQKEHQRYIITGTGRSGTGYMSRLLSYMHMPCGHEETFNPMAIAKANGAPPWSPFRGDASWLAGPFLADLQGVPVAHVVRNPLNVIRSMVGIGWLARDGVHGPYEEFAVAVMQLHGITEVDEWESLAGVDADVRRAKLIHRCSVFVAFWTEMIARDGNPWWRLEDVIADLQVAKEVIEHVSGMSMDTSRVQKAWSKVNSEGKYNTRTRDESITWADLPEAIGELAEHYGYETNRPDPAR